MIKCAFRKDSGCKSTNIILSDQTDNQSFAHFSFRPRYVTLRGSGGGLHSGCVATKPGPAVAPLPDANGKTSLPFVRRDENASKVPLYSPFLPHAPLACGGMCIFGAVKKLILRE